MAAIGFATGRLLLATDEPNQRLPVANTQRLDFPSGGTLRLTKSTGMVTVEAWERPDVEITTITSINKMRVAGGAVNGFGTNGLNNNSFWVGWYLDKNNNIVGFYETHPLILPIL